jgi:hypothetical protein
MTILSISALNAMTGLSVLAMTGCLQHNPLSCELPDNRNMSVCSDGDALPCTSNAQCTPTAAVCDLGVTNLCVQCTTSDNPCAAAMPVCVANQCQKCTMHAQFPASNACLPDGSCANPDDVAYVQAGGTGYRSDRPNLGSLAFYLS